MPEGILKALSDARRAAESRMLDTIKTTRKGEPVWDEDAGENVAQIIDVYTGKARIRHASSSPQDVAAGSQLLVIGSLEIHVPIGAALFAADDVVTVTASPTRPDQAGRVFYVLGSFDGSQTSSVRYRVESADSRG